MHAILKTITQADLRSKSNGMVEEETVQGAVVVRRPDDMEAAAAGDEAVVRGPLLYPGLPLAPEELFPIA